MSALVGLGLWIASSAFTRFFFDDYQMAWEYQNWGIRNQALVMYRGYSGRIDLVAMGGFLTGLGPRAALLAGPILICWLAVVVATIIGNALSRLGWQVGGRRQFIVGLVATAAVVAGTPQQFQSLRWLTGIMVYGLPTVLGLTAVALLSSPAESPTGRSARRVVRLALASVCLILSSGGNETQALAQPVLCVALTIALWRSARSRFHLAVATLSCTAGSALLLLSPGSRGRAAWQPASHDLATVSRAAVTNSFTFVAALIVHSFVPILSLLAIGALLRTWMPDRTPASIATQRRTTRLILGGTALFALLCFGAIIVVPAYSLNEPAPLRAYLPAWAALAGLLIVTGWLLQPRITLPTMDAELRKVLRAAVLVAVVAAPISLGVSMVRLFPANTRMAKQWDCIDRLLRSDHGDVVVAAPSEYEGIAFVLGKTTSYPNLMMARYYGSESVVGAPHGQCAIS